MSGANLGHDAYCKMFMNVIKCYKLRANAEFARYTFKMYIS